MKIKSKKSRIRGENWTTREVRALIYYWKQFKSSLAGPRLYNMLSGKLLDKNVERSSKQIAGKIKQLKAIFIRKKNAGEEGKKWKFYRLLFKHIYNDENDEIQEESADSEQNEDRNQDSGENSGQNIETTNDNGNNGNSFPVITLEIIHSLPIINPGIKKRIEKSQLSYKLPRNLMKKQHCYICRHCDAKFTFDINLLQHIKDFHPDSSALKYVCNICKFPCWTRKKLKKHQERHERDQKCEVCEKLFLNPENLKKHRKKHQFKCKLCNKFFINDYKLEAHVIEFH